MRAEELDGTEGFGDVGDLGAEGGGARERGLRHELVLAGEGDGVRYWYCGSGGWRRYAIISWNFCSAGSTSGRVGAKVDTSAMKGAVGMPRGFFAGSSAAADMMVV